MTESEIHSREAERLLRLADSEQEYKDDTYYLVAASVHAALAIAAAVRDDRPEPERVNYDYDDPTLPGRLERGRVITGGRPDPLDDPTVDVPPDVTREVPRFGGAQ